MSPLVSVIIPTYRRPDLVSRAIRSVLDQTYEPLECIVVDDCPTEQRTAQIVESVADDRVTYLQHADNSGLSDARNTGIAEATGTYIAFLDDDDEWVPEKLEKQVRLLEELDGEYGMVYSWMDYVDADGNVETQYRPTHDGYIFPATLAGQPIGSGSTLLVRSSVVEDIGGFDESLPRGIDGDFIRRIAKDYKIDYVAEALVRYHFDHDHERITREDETGIRNAIRGHESKLTKFEEELRAHPTQTATIHAEIANLYGRIGEWGSCLTYYTRAVRLSPMSTNVYRRMLMSMKTGVEDALTHD